MVKGSIEGLYPPSLIHKATKHCSSWVLLCLVVHQSARPLHQEHSSLKHDKHCGNKSMQKYTLTCILQQLGQGITLFQLVQQ